MEKVREILSARHNNAHAELFGIPDRFSKAT